MHKRYIVIQSIMYGGGYWGAGETLEEATKRCRETGGLKRKSKPTRCLEFTSDMPFAPSSRSAADDESDCWVGKDGSLNWLRCEKHELSLETAAT